MNRSILLIVLLFSGSLCAGSSESDSANIKEFFSDYIYLPDSLIFEGDVVIWENGRITGLNLKGYESNPRTYEASCPIFRLDKLQLLVIESRVLNIMPNEFYNLKELKHLKIRPTYQFGEDYQKIPDTLCNLFQIFDRLTNLTHLELSYCNLSLDSFSLDNLTKLKYLNLSNNRFTELPKGLTSLRALDTLVLDSNRLDTSKLDNSEKLFLSKFDNTLNEQFLERFNGESLLSKDLLVVGNTWNYDIYDWIWDHKESPSNWPESRYKIKAKVKFTIIEKKHENSNLIIKLQNIHKRFSEDKPRIDTMLLTFRNDTLISKKGHYMGNGLPFIWDNIENGQPYYFTDNLSFPSPQGMESWYSRDEIPKFRSKYDISDTVVISINYDYNPSYDLFYKTIGNSFFSPQLGLLYSEVYMRHWKCSRSNFCVLRKFNDEKVTLFMNSIDSLVNNSDVTHIIKETTLEETFFPKSIHHLFDKYADNPDCRITISNIKGQIIKKASSKEMYYEAIRQLPKGVYLASASVGLITHTFKVRN